ncbi:CHAT domain-containing protein [Actinoalloteichus hoggarensis]|uniref:CHAT domain-containing protein n=1 Tax=Actinoalloteichus hoggarensis TaxID=1470176 RepID=UPI0012FDDF1A|nr:CHAT domain-containing protein [Actinoalloteichus hoggarensis]
MLREVACLHWWRYHALGVDDGPDLEICLELFAPLAAAFPDALPPPVLAWFRENPPVQSPPAGSGSFYATVVSNVASMTSNPILLGLAIDSCRAAISVNMPGDRFAHRFNLLILSCRRFEMTGVEFDLDAGIAAGMAALDAVGETGTAPEASAAVRLHLGAALITRFGLRGRRRNLSDGTALLREAVRLIPPDHPEHAGCLGQLAVALQICCELGGSAELVAEYVSVTGDLLTIDGLDESARAEALALRSDALRARFVRGGDRADVEESVRCARAAVERLPDGHESVVSARLTLTRALAARFALARTHGLAGGADPADHAEALALARRLDTDVPRDHPRRSAVDALSAAVLSMSDADPDGAVQAARTVLADLPPDSPYRGSALFSLGNALRAAHQRTGEEALLWEAVELLRAAANTDTGGEGPLGRTPTLTALSMTLYTALRRLDVGDAAAPLLDEAVETTRAVVEDLPVEAIRGGQLWQLAELLAMRFARTGRGEDLDERIVVLRTAAPLAPDEATSYECLSTLADALRLRYSRAWAPADLDEYVAIRCRLAELPPEDHPALPGFQADAALALLHEFEARGGRDCLERATALARRAITAGPAHEHWHGMLSILAVVLAAVAVPARDVAALDELVDVCRAATPEGRPVPGIVAVTLGRALAVRAEVTGDTADLAGALAALRLAAADPAEPSRFGAATSLILALRSRFGRGGDVRDLTEAIESGVSVLASTVAGSLETAMLAAHVAAARSDRYEATRDPADITEAIDTLRSVLRAAADAPASWTFRLYLGSALLARFRGTARVADLEESIEVLRACLVEAERFGETTPGRLMLADALLSWGRWSDDQDALVEARELAQAVADGSQAADSLRATAEIIAANALHLRYLDSGDPALLTEATRIAREVLDVVPSGDRDHTHALILLGGLLKQSFERTGDGGTITEAVEVLQRAAAAAWTRTTEASALAELANALRARQDVLPEIGDPDEAIAVAERGVALAASGPGEHAAHRTALASALYARFLRTGDLDALNSAVDHCRVAVGTPDARVSAVLTLATLGAALSGRYDRVGNTTDLHEAIEVLRTAARTAHAGHTMRPVLLTNLSNALRTRAGLLGSAADLDAAVETGRAAVDAVSDGHPSAALCLMNLGTALAVRAQENRDSGDHEAAVVAMSRALERSGPEPSGRARILINLAGLLRGRRRRTSDSDDLDRALVLLRETLTIIDAEHPLVPQAEFLLAMTFRERHVRDHRPEDLIAAVQSVRRAIGGLDDGDPRCAVTRWILGSLHEQGDDPESAARAYRAAVESPAAPPLIRAVAARSWAETAVRLRNWSDAMEAFTATVAQLPQVAWHGIERGARERRLRIWEGLATEAAAAALSAGDADRAVELLEQGRSVLWSQTLQTRDDFSVLQERDPVLHDRLRAAATRLTAAADVDMPDGGGAPEPWGDRGHQERFDRIRLAQDWDRLLAEARALPGLEYLLRVPPTATLRAGLPSDGPVVLVNVDRARCDALIVYRDRDVEHVPLPALSQAEVAGRARAYWRALRSWERSGGSGGLTAIGARQTLHATLEWLWDAIAEPVLDRLEPGDADGSPPRLWWCPTGLLTLLPLHAAGYHDPADGLAGCTVLDRVVSSYTPTLRALARAAAAGAAREADRRILVVSLPETPPRPDRRPLGELPGARAEADLLRAAFPESHTLRTAHAATRAAITADLRTHAYVHFACHGGHDPRDPSTGALHLWDEPLTVLDVAELRLEHAEFAFLSACSTATGGTTLPDEAIHLAAALQLAGYRQVIATLWNIPDRTAPEVAATLYAALREQAGLRLDDTARVLHGVVRALRDSAPRDPTIWAAYIHSGP